MRITLDSAQAQDFGDAFEDDPIELDGFSYVLYEESDQINELKYVHWDRIYKRSDGKFFLQNCSKSGSYWSDYYFEYGEVLYEVKEVLVSKTEWQLVK